MFMNWTYEKHVILDTFQERIWGKPSFLQTMYKQDAITWADFLPRVKFLFNTSLK